jgi:hypothetical protein
VSYLRGRVSLSLSLCLSSSLGVFITIATDKFKELCQLFESCDRSVSSIKRHLGETVLGCAGTSGGSEGPEEDPWQTFFALLVKFAEMYKLSILELEDWKKAELRLQLRNEHALTSSTSTKIEISQFKRENLKQTPERSPKQQHRKNQSSAGSGGNAGNVMEVFKERLQIIRKRNSTNFDDSDLSDNEPSEW